MSVSTSAVPATSRVGIAASLAIGIVCLTAIVGPLPLGGTHVLATLGIQAAMAFVICLWAVFMRPSPLSLAIPLGWLLLPLLQLVPLPDWILVAIAPVSAGAWKVTHAGMPHAWGRISIDPAETAAAARRAMLAIGTIAAVADLAQYVSFRRILVAAIACSGAIIWTLGILFPVEPNTFVLLGFISFKGPLMPGRTPLEPPVATAAFGYPEIVQVAGHRYVADSWIVGDGFGPYLITNHFAGALVLTVPFLVAAWLWATSERLPGWVRHGIGAAAFTGAGATVAALAQSRAGTAACLMSMLVFAWLASPQGRWRSAMKWSTLAYTVALLAFIAVLFGPFHGIENWFPEPLQTRVSGILSDGRVVATRVAERMFLASPLLGTGLGTYGDLYPVMVADGTPWYFAHNDYAQLLAESGIVGLALASVPAMLFYGAAVAFQRVAAGAERTLGAAAWASVMGIAVHSCFDWNLRVPANGFLACVAAAIAIATSSRAGGPTPSVGLHIRLRTVMAAALVLLVLVATGFLFRDAASEIVQRRLREAVAAARLHAADAKSAVPDTRLADAIAAGERMAEWDPHDAQLAVVLGQANLYLSTMSLPIDDADDRLRQAANWFRQAKLNCAACRGVGEAD